MLLNALTTFLVGFNGVTAIELTNDLMIFNLNYSDLPKLMDLQFLSYIIRAELNVL